jgi:hypothetical protein
MNAKAKNTIFRSLDLLRVSGIILLVTLLLLEFCSWLFFESFTEQAFDFDSQSRQRKIRITELEQKLSPQKNHANMLFRFHPFLGYSGVPGARPWGNKAPPFNDYGMLSTSNHPYPYEKREGDLVIAILGGSVAEIFANQAESHFQRFAEEEHDFHGRIVFINLAAGGYKQPQQLFHLQLSILSGFQFDIVLNLDGFNDLALAQQNLSLSVNPLYPSFQHFALMAKLSDAPDRQTVKDLNTFHNLLTREISLLRLVESTPFRHSPFFSLLGAIGSKHYKTKISQTQYSLTTNAQTNITSSFTGPPLTNQTPKTPVIVWQEASRQMHAIANQVGLTYVHALQPNQYLEGSKPLSKLEKEIAYNPDHPWGMIIKSEYASMKKAGYELQNEGIPFHDLTDIFAGNNEDLYVDDCCHIGERGNEILAQTLAGIVLKEHRRQTSDVMLNDNSTGEEEEVAFSTRGITLGSEDPLILSFVVPARKGNTPVVVRVRGTTLTENDVTNALRNPSASLFKGSEFLSIVKGVDESVRTNYMGIPDIKDYAHVKYQLSSGVYSVLVSPKEGNGTALIDVVLKR